MVTDACFADRLHEAIRKKGSPLCCGLDPQLRYMPPHLIRAVVQRYGQTFRAVSELFLWFNRAIIDAVHDLVSCVKPQRAFYEAYGPSGDIAFYETVKYAQNAGLLVIQDAKRNDGGDTADAYADAYLGRVPFFGTDDPMILRRLKPDVQPDCLTVTPYIADDCVPRFVARVKEFGTGIFVVTKTSFKPNSAVEQLPVFQPRNPGGPEKNTVLAWQEVAKMVQAWGEGTEGACGLRNVGVVMGATYPTDAVRMREILPNSFFLVPGYGGQGAGAAEAVMGARQDGSGFVVNNSRNLTFAWQNAKGKFACKSEKFADAARAQATEDRDALVAACKAAGKWSF